MPSQGNSNPPNTTDGHERGKANEYDNGGDAPGLFSPGLMRLRQHPYRGDSYEEQEKSPIEER